MKAGPSLTLEVAGARPGLSGGLAKRRRPPFRPDASLIDASVLARLAGDALRLTRHRHAVLVALGALGPRASVPINADELLRRVQAEGCNIGTTSLYRVLHDFERAGIATRRMLPSGRFGYSLDDHRPHHLLACARCDRTVEFHDADLQAHASRITGHLVAAPQPGRAEPQITLSAPCLGCGRDTTNLEGPACPR